VIHSARSIQVHLQSMPVACSRASVGVTPGAVAPTDASPETHPETSPGRPVVCGPSYSPHAGADAARNGAANRPGYGPVRTGVDTQVERPVTRPVTRQEDWTLGSPEASPEARYEDRVPDRQVSTSPDARANGPPRASPEAVGGTGVFSSWNGTLLRGEMMFRVSKPTVEQRLEGPVRRYRRQMEARGANPGQYQPACGGNPKLQTLNLTRCARVTSCQCPVCSKGSRS
jgi:hypothetical protein